MIPLSALPLRFYKGRVYPAFMYLYDSRKIDYVINLYESLLNQEFDEEFVKSSLESFFGNFKIAKAIYYVMRYFYDVRGKVEKIGHYSRFDLKKRFYEWVGRKYIFIRQSEWSNVIREFCEHMNIDFNAFKDFLESDLPENLILVRKREKPSAKKIIGLYNFLILEKILSISEYVELKYYGELRGKIVKDLIIRAKYHEVLADFIKGKNYLEIRVTGPHQLFKLPAVSEYGKHIAAVIAPIIINYEKWRLYAKIIYRKRGAYFVMDTTSGNDVYLVPYWSIDKSLMPEKTFDSSIEERINKLFLASMSDKGFKISRESDVIMLNDGTLIIPDFSVIKDSRKVYVEIIGYWRDKYVKKKIEKLNKMVDEGYNIIGIADSKLKRKLKDIKIPVFYYDSDHIPFGRIYKKIIELI